MINWKLRQYEGICKMAANCNRCNNRPALYSDEPPQKEEGIGGYCMYSRLSKEQIKEILDEQEFIDREMERRWHFTFRM